MGNLPDTKTECAGCGNELSLLGEFLQMQFKPVRGVLISSETPGESETDVANVNYSLGTKSGRGVICKFHDFACMHEWVDARKDLKPKLEFHFEDEIYVPEDNRSPEELVEAGEFPAELAAAYAKMAESGDE